MQPHAFNAEDELGTDIIEKLRSGKGEKKRFFVLTRSRVPLKDQEAANLSWYNSKPEGTLRDNEQMICMIMGSKRFIQARRRKRLGALTSFRRIPFAS